MSYRTGAGILLFIGATLAVNGHVAAAIFVAAAVLATGLFWLLEDDEPHRDARRRNHR